MAYLALLPSILICYVLCKMRLQLLPHCHHVGMEFWMEHGGQSEHLGCFHTSCCTALFLDMGITHSTLLKLAPLSKRDNHQRIWVIQFDWQNWLHWTINQAQWAIFLQKRARIMVSIGNRVVCLYWHIAKKELPWPIKQLSFDFLSCNWSNNQAIFAIEE